MSLPLLITDDEHVPIYLQVVHQIRYLITGRELVEGAQLPSVRQLATDLGVNAGTVAQAYRILQQEGLIDSRRGTGTFVSSLGGSALRQGRRNRSLAEAADRFVARAHALGFNAMDIRQSLTNRLSQPNRRFPVVVLGPSRVGAEKYASLVTELLAPAVNAVAHAATVEALERGNPEVRAPYGEAYFTLCFLSVAPRVEQALQRQGIDSEVVGFTARLTGATRAMLGDLDPADRHFLVTEERNVNAALSLIGQHASVDLRAITVLTERSPDAAWHGVAKGTVLHTFGVKTLLDQHGIEATQRRALTFELDEESRERIQSIIHPALPVPD